MSDEFLLVVPATGWIEVAEAASWLNSNGPEHIRGLILDGDMNQFSQFLEGSGLIAPNTVVSEARYMDTADGPRVWYKL